MSTKYDNFIAVSAAWTVNERMIYHTQAGRMLAGLNYDSEGTFKVEGHDDLPLLQPWTIGIQEDIFAGAPKFSASGVREKNSPVAETLTLVYRIAVARKHGWFRRDPTNSSAPKGFIEWLALIRDAMEATTTDPSTSDAALDIGAVKPVRFAVRESDTSQLSFSCYLEVEIAVQPYCRAERTFTLP